MKELLSEAKCGVVFLFLVVGMLAAQENDPTFDPPRIDSLSSKQQVNLPAHTLRILNREYIQRSPIRNLDNLLALENGVVLQDGELHARGGRAGQIAYFLDGATATNPFFNTASFPFIPEAVEEIRLHTGAYPAELGGGNSALVETILRSGGPTFEATLDYRTDGFAKPGNEFLGAAPLGYREAIITLGGPAPSIPRLKFFIAGRHKYFRSRDAIFIEPFRFEELVTDALGSRPSGTPLPGPVAFEQNYLPGNWLRENALQGALTFDAKPVEVRFTGAYSNVEQRLDHDWPIAINNLFTRKERVDEERNALLNLQATHRLNSSLLYQIAVSYSSRSQRIFDSDFGDNWMLYVDSLANADAGYPGFNSRWEGPLQYSIVQNFQLNDPNAPVNSYLKNDQENLGFSADFTAKFNSKYELKFGGRLDRWTMRRYDVNNILSYMIFAYGRDGKTPRTFESGLARRVRLDRAGIIDRFGYDVDGIEIDGGPEGQRKPSFASIYLQNRLHYGKALIELGLRYERFDLKVPMPADFENPVIIETLNYLDETTLVRTKPEEFVLPRLSIAFPISQRTDFFAAFGEYAQMPALRDIYVSNRVLSHATSPVTRTGIVGFTAKPERSRHIEFGVRHTLRNGIDLSATIFFDKSKNLLRLGRVFAEGTGTVPAGPPLFEALLNDDDADASGFEFNLDLKRTKRLSARVNYAYTDAKGTEADLRSLANSSFFDRRIVPQSYTLSYQQKHRGSILMNYRFDEVELGNIFEGMGLSTILSFNSGYLYTSIRELSNLSNATPWNIGVYPLTNPSLFYSLTIEEPNSSTTPWNFNFDFSLNKVFDIAGIGTELRLDVLNVFDTKHVINVYPQTGSATNDAWLRSPMARPFLSIPNYVEFYKAVNEQNRWAYSLATGNDLFGAPRQIRFGMRLEL